MKSTTINTQLPQADQQKIKQSFISLAEMQRIQLPEALLDLKKNPPPGRNWHFGLEHYSSDQDFREWAGIKDADGMLVTALIEHPMHAFLKVWALLRTSAVSESIKKRWYIFVLADLLERLRTAVGHMFYHQCIYTLQSKLDYLDQQISLGNQLHVERQAHQLYTMSLQFGNDVEILLSSALSNEKANGIPQTINDLAGGYALTDLKTNGFKAVMNCIIASIQK